MATSTDSAVRSFLLSEPEVVLLDDLRRLSIIFHQGQAADALYYIASGLVKLTRTSLLGGRIIYAIRGKGDFVGEESLTSEDAAFLSEAETILPSNLYRIPRMTLMNVLSQQPTLAATLLEVVVRCRNAMAEKVELLCLHDVEYRVLQALESLSSVVGASGDGGHQIPITQLELADLIGATRETTSTVLNQLERRNLVHLSRRMLTVPSVDRIQAALQGAEEPEVEVAANSARTLHAV